ncbi:toprim domain-containing protein [Phenylobacterium sp.]|uniref:DUF7146 domain-containing protein n=1 Tax=Phenylobacterium sp. TaxID=1871053 RepID=UPI0035B04B1B
MSLAHIVRVLGGDLWDGGRRANVPGPGHGPADRSASLLLVDGRVIAHSFAGQDWREILQDLRRRGLINAAGRPGGGETTTTSPPLSLRERLARARALWAEGVELGGTPAARHLQRRAVTGGGPALRAHPAVAAAVYADQGPCRPALLAGVRAPDGAICAVEVTYLAANGLTARVRSPRKTIGVLPPGCAVRLDDAASELVVGEGVFTCLSAAEHLQRPAWALLSAGGLSRWSPPPSVRRVLVAADRDRTGLRAARRLAVRLRACGLAVALRLPPRGFSDWNAFAQAIRGPVGGSPGQPGRSRPGT